MKNLRFVKLAAQHALEHRMCTWPERMKAFRVFQHIQIFVSVGNCREEPIGIVFSGVWFHFMDFNLRLIGPEGILKLYIICLKLLQYKLLKGS